MVSDEPVHVDVHDDVGVVWVNRPERRNAMDIPTREALRTAFERLARDGDVRVIVLRGAGSDAFIAGGDLDAFAEMDLVEGLEYLARHAGGLYDYLAGIPKPTIAAIDGPALGGGLEIALACDIRLATEDAVFGLPETTLGIIPAAGGTQRLPGIVGVGVAKELIFTGRVVDAAEAEAVGLVNHVHPADEFEDRVAELAGRLADQPPIALRFAKEAINLTATDPAGLSFERAAGTALWGTRDKAEGIAAFREGRDPEFEGR